MNHAVIQRFVDSVRQSARARSKVVTLPMEQAQDLASELALLLLRENELLREINQLKGASQITEVVVGGGSFKS